MPCGATRAALRCIRSLQARVYGRCAGFSGGTGTRVGKTLVVCIPGLYGSRSPDWYKSPLRKLQALIECAPWYRDRPRQHLEASKAWCRLASSLAADDEVSVKIQWHGLEFRSLQWCWQRELERLASGLAVGIRAWVDALDEQSSAKVSRVILVGHSTGGLLVKCAFLDALDRGLAWACKVERIVLLSSINRGFNSKGVPLVAERGLFWCHPILEFLRIAGLRRCLVADEAQADAAFVARTRLRWARYWHSQRHSNGSGPEVVNVVGREDPVVLDLDAREDLDLCRLRAIHWVVPNCDHFNLIDTRFAGGTASIGPRLEVAVLVSLKDVKCHYAEDMFVEYSPRAKLPRRIVLALHGIRSNSDGWSRELKERVEADRFPNVIVETPTYGRMSALQFAWPFTRRRSVGWFFQRFLHWYSVAPDAQFTLIGHSNGTYVIKRAIDELRCAAPGAPVDLRVLPASLRVDRIVMMAPVLRPSEPGMSDWFRGMGADRLVVVTGDRDAIVGFLAGALSLLSDVGTAGLNGFRGVDYTHFVAEGGHDAPFAARVSGSQAFSGNPKLRWLADVVQGIEKIPEAVGTGFEERAPLPRGQGLWLCFRCVWWRVALVVAGGWLLSTFPITLSPWLLAVTLLILVAASI